MTSTSRHCPRATSRAHQQARNIIGEWITWSWHPTLTGQWQHRLRLIGADARHPGPWLNAVTHPELLAVASLLLAARQRDIDTEREAPSRLGFPYQLCPGGRACRWAISNTRP